MARRFDGQLPTAAVRLSDSYRLPIYPTYQAFLAANQGLRGRFGLLGTQPLVRTSTGTQKAVRITVNNALVFFVDSRNQGKFLLEPANLKIQLMPRSEQVQKVLADASKASLQRLIDFKKFRAIPIQSSTPKSTSFDWRFIPAKAWSIASVRPSGLLGQGEPASQVLLAQIQPLAYCKVQSSFYRELCAELEAKGIQEVGQCETVFIGRDRELTLCRLLFDEIVKIQGGAPVAAPQGGQSAPSAAPADGSVVDPLASNPGDPAGDAGSIEVLDAGDAEVVDAQDGAAVAESQEQFDDPSKMLPDGMAAPAGPSCNATTLGEQFMCALLMALTNMLQQAFSH